MMFRALFVLAAAMLALAMAAPEPKADPQLLYASGLATPYVYAAPAYANAPYSYTPYAAGYFGNYYYNSPYAAIKPTIYY